MIRSKFWGANTLQKIYKGLAADRDTIDESIRDGAVHKIKDHLFEIHSRIVIDEREEDIIYYAGYIDEGFYDIYAFKLGSLENEDDYKSRVKENKK
jgi:hypothetical protein